MLGVKIIHNLGDCGHLMISAWRFLQRFVGCNTVLNFTICSLCLCLINHRLKGYIKHIIIIHVASY